MAAVLFVARPAWSEPASETVSACIDEYEGAQELRKKDDLLGARKALQSCTSAVCPAMIRSDCTRWLAEVVEETPSIVLAAVLGGENVFDVSVSMDGAPLARQLDGKPIAVNPGIHTFTFARPDQPTIEKKVLIAANRGGQLVAAEWKAAPSTLRVSPPVRPRFERPVPALVFVLGGVAVAGFGTFAVLGLTGNAMEHELETTCSPHCSDPQVTSLRDHYLGADIAVAVAGVSGSAAIVLFFTRPERAVAPGAWSMHLSPMLGGATVSWGATF